MKALKYLIPAIVLLLLTGTAFASFYPSGGSTYRLASSISSTDTTVNLSSFKEPTSGIPYTMSYLNSAIECGTLDPQNSNSEFISFTGITQNGNGTAQLTGISRGLGRSYPYTASTTLASAHAGGSIFILSDAPCLFTNYAAIANSETVTGNWDVPYPADSNSVVPRSYVDGTAFGGVGGASETATGTVQIATGLQTASSTKNGSIGRLVIPSSLSTSTWSASIPVGTVPVIGTVGGKLDPNFIAQQALSSTTVIGSFPAFQIGKNEYATSSGNTFTLPSGVTTFFVRMVGGGGSGGNNGSGCVGGGGSGAYIEGLVSTTTSIKYSVGTGGTLPSTGNPGNTGNATTLGTGWSAGAGTGGGFVNNTGSACAGGSGGTATGATTGMDATSTGSGGGPGINSTNGTVEGIGGMSVLGFPGSGGNGQTAGTSGEIIFNW